MKEISILGSTGSIGQNTLEVIAAHPDKFNVRALAAGTNVSLLKEQIERFRPEFVALATEEAADKLRERLAGTETAVLSGIDGLIAVATHSDVKMVVSAIVGAAGLVPTMAAIEAGKDIALANKETLVTAGPLVMGAVERAGVQLFPVDSEHSAIFQSLVGHRHGDVRRLILTASGGPFRATSLEALKQVTAAQALAHPNWSMGKKISVDSATMMNKGLEVIEASFLFDLPGKQISVHVHPESIVHSMVEYIDGAVIAQMGLPDMKTPIAYALSYPERVELNQPEMDLCSIGRLNFEEPDHLRFPCLKLAYQALEEGGDAPAVLNAANEVAVQFFLSGQLAFLQIPEVVSRVLEMNDPSGLTTVSEVLRKDRWARERSLEVIRQLEGACA